MSSEQEKKEQENVTQQSGETAGQTTSVELGEQQQPLQASTGEAQNEAQDPNYSYGIFSSRMRFDPLAIVFIILLLIGGLIGYLSKGSLASIISAAIFAVLLAIATYMEGAKG